jgi:hypothetical protein
MPEVNVHGLGVLDALQRICDATGFAFACLPAALTDTGDEAPYELSIWRRNSGTIVYPKLAKRGTTFADTEAALAQNDTNKSMILRDNAEIVNEVHAIGRTVIEGVFTLIPLWSPSEVDSATVDATLQEVNETNLAGSGYHAKHVVDGALYNQYRHVGRWWGLNHDTVTWGYTTPANYVPSALGFDWVDDGEMNAADSAMLAEREANGLSGGDEAILWTKRLRTPMPLRYPLAVQRGIEYLVRVSEDAGTTWYELALRIKTLRDWFGVELLGIKNLASVNRATFGTDETPAVEDSWWALIASGQLQFQIGCAVEADHAAEYRATRSATSGSRYNLAKVVMTDIEERWAHAGLSLAMTGATAQAATWAKIPTYTHDAPDTSPASLRAVAERERDALEDGVVSATLSTWIMDFTRYALGQQVGGISGRNYSFAVSSGAAGVRYPNIVGITYRLSGGQSIELSLDDHRLAAGR